MSWLKTKNLGRKTNSVALIHRHFNNDDTFQYNLHLFQTESTLRFGSLGLNSNLMRASDMIIHQYETFPG